MKRLDTGGDNDLASVESLRNDCLRFVEPLHIHIADRHRVGGRINDPYGGPLIHPDQCGGRYVYHRPRIGDHATDDRCAEAHGWWRIRQTYPDLEGPGDGAGLRGNLADTSLRRYCRIICQADVDFRVSRG